MSLTKIQTMGLLACFAAAKAAGHPYPGIAAAEGALETRTDDGGWFTSPLYIKSNNYLGLKAPSWYKGAVVEMPTREFLATGKTRPASWRNPRMPQPRNGGTSWLIDDEFCHFNSLDDCARCQMIVLRRDYSEAFSAPTAQAFADILSAKWSTGPERGRVVNAIYSAHLDILGPTMLVAQGAIKGANGENNS